MGIFFDWQDQPAIIATRLLVTLIVMAFAFPQCTGVALAEAGTETIEDKGIHLYQTSGILGDQHVYITDQSIKIVDKSSDLVTISKAPSWTVTTYEPVSRTGCTLRLKRFRGYIPASNFNNTGIKWSLLPFKKERVEKIKGIPATTFVTTAAFTKQQIKDWQREFADSKFIKSAQYCVSTKYDVPRQAILILSRFYGLADRGGLPIQFKYHDLGGILHMGLITTSLSEIDASKIDLSLPSQLKPVESPEQLLKIVESRRNKVKKRRPLL